MAPILRIPQRSSYNWGLCDEERHNCHGGCSSLAQFTDSIGQPSPGGHRASPNNKNHTQMHGPTSCASLAQLTERVGQPSPNSIQSGLRPPTSLPPNMPPLGQFAGIPGLPPGFPFTAPMWNYAQPPRPGQVIPPLYPGLPGMPGFPPGFPMTPLQPPSSSPASKQSTPKSGSQRSGPGSAQSPVGPSHGQNSSGGPVQSPLHHSSP
jgi:hypothetical protein